MVLIFLYLLTFFVPFERIRTIPTNVAIAYATDHTYDVTGTGVAINLPFRVLLRSELP